MRALVEQNSRLVRAQSTPLLAFETGNEDDDHPVISFDISNDGTGPAVIKWFRMVDAAGTDYSGSALTRRVIQVQPGGQESSEEISATLMRSGENRSIFRWPKPVGNDAATVQWKELDRIRSQLHPSACYCSMFDECWITAFDGGVPQPVRTCVAAPPEREAPS